MRLSLLLLAGIGATLTSGCMFPFNNPRLTNSSLVADYVADLQAKFNDGDQDGGGNGWVTTIGRGTVEPTAWPKNSHSAQVTYIYYCYPTHAEYAALKDVVNEAAVMWRNKLGPGSVNGHHFDGFRHYFDKDTMSYPRCYTDMNQPQQGWNPAVPHGTLVIRHSSKGYSESTVGYRDTTIDPSPDRHFMNIVTGPFLHRDWVLLVAHELGHVLGFVHEHQRQDRDAYVNFDCSKLRGYADAKSQIEAHTEWGISIEEVCKSNYLGMTHGLDFGEPFDYSTDMGQDRSQTLGKSYDHDSIMQYPSFANAATPSGGVRDLPLVRWKNGRPKDGSPVDESNAQIIPYHSAISDGDKEGIQHLYPWAG